MTGGLNDAAQFQREYLEELALVQKKYARIGVAYGLTDAKIKDIQIACIASLMVVRLHSEIQSKVVDALACFMNDAQETSDRLFAFDSGMKKTS
jgi:hypothetical protein